MSKFKLDNETAERIAGALAVLPEIETGRFIEVLIDNLGEELNCETLKNITVTHLKTGLGDSDGEEDSEDIGIGLPAMKEAVRILWGEVADENKIPKPVAYADDMPGSIRVAIASNTGENLDGHFGSCLRYLIYQVSTSKYKLIDVRSALEADLADEKIAFRINLIRDCHMVYLISVGGPAAGKVVQSGIYPIKQPEGGNAVDIMKSLQTMIATSPPPWMAKILGVSVGERVKNYQG